MNLATVTDPKYEGFSFGSGEPAKMADDIESGKTIVHQVRLIQRLQQDDFYVQSLIIRFYEHAHR